MEPLLWSCTLRVTCLEAGDMCPPHQQTLGAAAWGLRLWLAGGHGWGGVGRFGWGGVKWSGKVGGERSGWGGVEWRPARRIRLPPWVRLPLPWAVGLAPSFSLAWLTWHRVKAG